TFSEAISISKKNKCNIIVSIRDTTYIRHRNDSIFNAYELKRFWIEPPSFKEILSKRLTYAKKILKNESANIELHNGAILSVDDLSVFFDIVQKSLLNEENGRYLEYLSDRNPRKGISFVQNFLSSAHIQADKAIQNYIEGEANFIFPYHELFKGSMLSQWKYYRETRSNAVNLYDSNMAYRKLQLIRLYLLNLLYKHSRTENSVETNLQFLVNKLSYLAISKDKLLEVISILLENELIYSNNLEVKNPTYNLTLSGGYYINILCYNFVYIEDVLQDKNIQRQEQFETLKQQTLVTYKDDNIVERLILRRERVASFMEYLNMVEKYAIKEKSKLSYLKMINNIKKMF